jgi:hypothetical protein
VPFAIVTVRREDGSERQARFWPTTVQSERATGVPFVHRYFAEVDKSDFMLIQDRVFGPIFRGYSFFYSQRRRNPALIKKDIPPARSGLNKSLSCIFEIRFGTQYLPVTGSG